MPQAIVVSRPSAGCGLVGAGVEEDEAPGAVGVLRLARLAASLAEQRRLLVAGDPGDRHLGAELARRPVDVGGGQRLRQALRVDAEQLAELGVPAPLADVEEHRPRRVGEVGRVTAGELEDEPGVDRPEDRVGRLGDVSQQPLDLGRREVRVEDEAGALADQLLAALVAKLAAAGRRAPVLPDERVVDRLAGLRVPGDDRLALIRDPDAREAARVGLRVGEGVRGDAARHLPDLVRVVLDPPRAREVLAGTRCRRGRGSCRRGRRRGRSCRSSPGRSRGSSGASLLRTPLLSPRATPPVADRPVSPITRGPPASIGSSLCAEVVGGGPKPRRRRSGPAQWRRVGRSSESTVPRGSRERHLRPRSCPVVSGILGAACASWPSSASWRSAKRPAIEAIAARPRGRAVFARCRAVAAWPRSGSAVASSLSASRSGWRVEHRPTAASVRPARSRSSSA